MIITLGKKEDVSEAINNGLIDINKYVCFSADDNTVAIKPVVSTRGRDIFVLQKLTKNEVTSIEGLFIKKMHVRSITFREDTYQP